MIRKGPKRHVSAGAGLSHDRTFPADKGEFFTDELRRCRGIGGVLRLETNKGSAGTFVVELDAVQALPALSILMTSGAANRDEQARKQEPSSAFFRTVRDRLMSGGCGPAVSLSIVTIWQYFFRQLIRTGEIYECKYARRWHLKISDNHHASAAVPDARANEKGRTRRPDTCASGLAGCKANQKLKTTPAAILVMSLCGFCTSRRPSMAGVKA